MVLQCFLSELAAERGIPVEDLLLVVDNPRVAPQSRVGTKELKHLRGGSNHSSSASREKDRWQGMSSSLQRSESDSSMLMPTRRLGSLTPPGKAEDALNNSDSQLLAFLPTPRRLNHADVKKKTRRRKERKTVDEDIMDSLESFRAKYKVGAGSLVGSPTRMRVNNDNGGDNDSGENFVPMSPLTRFLVTRGESLPLSPPKRSRSRSPSQWLTANPNDAGWWNHPSPGESNPVAATAIAAAAKMAGSAGSYKRDSGKKSHKLKSRLLKVNTGSSPNATWWTLSKEADDEPVPPSNKLLSQIEELGV